MADLTYRINGEDYGTVDLVADIEIILEYDRNEKFFRSVRDRINNVRTPKAETKAKAKILTEYGWHPLTGGRIIKPVEVGIVLSKTLDSVMKKRVNPEYIANFTEAKARVHEYNSNLAEVLAEAEKQREAAELKRAEDGFDFMDSKSKTDPFYQHMRALRADPPRAETD